MADRTAPRISDALLASLLRGSTPGPWVFDEAEGLILSIPPGAAEAPCVTECGAMTVDAQLIAAAPELALDLRDTRAAIDAQADQLDEARAEVARLREALAAADVLHGEVTGSAAANWGPGASGRGGPGIKAALGAWRAARASLVEDGTDG